MSIADKFPHTIPDTTWSVEYVEVDTYTLTMHVKSRKTYAGYMQSDISSIKVAEITIIEPNAENLEDTLLAEAEKINRVAHIKYNLGFIRPLKEFPRVNADISIRI